MKIYVDADACPVVAIVEQIAKEYEIPVTLLCDTNHVLYSDYSEVVTVGAGADAVDFKLVSLCHKGDIVVTQDYGVAAMILGKGAYGIHQNGKWYTNENIDRTATLTNRRRILCWKGWQMQDISVRGIYCLIMAVEKEE